MAAGSWSRRRALGAAEPEKAEAEAGSERPLLRIGLVADAQFADVAPAGTRHYRRSLAKLGEAVERFNREDLAFVVHLGDLIDREWSSFDAILPVLSTCRHPVRHVLGNHDFEVADSLKPRVPERLGMGTRHHAFAAGGFRFLVLDTNDVSTYAHPADSPRTAGARDRLSVLEGSGLAQARPWNGALGEKQLAWFSRQLEAARQAGEPVVVFSHHPLHPAGGHNAWNDEEVLAIAGGHDSPVVAWFCGHNHAGAFGSRDGVHHVTLHGMVETEATNAFAVARLHADRIQLEGHGREPSRTLAFA